MIYYPLSRSRQYPFLRTENNQGTQPERHIAASQTTHLLDTNDTNRPNHNGGNSWNTFITETESKLWIRVLTFYYIYGIYTGVHLIWIPEILRFVTPGPAI